MPRLSPVRSSTFNDIKYALDVNRLPSRPRQSPLPLIGQSGKGIVPQSTAPSASSGNCRRVNSSGSYSKSSMTSGSEFIELDAFNLLLQIFYLQASCRQELI